MTLFFAWRAKIALVMRPGDISWECFFDLGLEKATERITNNKGDWL